MTKGVVSSRTRSAFSVAASYGLRVSETGHALTVPIESIARRIALSKNTATRVITSLGMARRRMDAVALLR